MRDHIHVMETGDRKREKEMKFEERLTKFNFGRSGEVFWDIIVE